MPVKSDDPLRRVTLNLYEADCKVLEERLGHGWTSEVREAVHEYANRVSGVTRRTNTTNINFPMPRRTLGDLE